MNGKILITALAALLLAFLLGCGSSNPQTANNSPTPSSPSPTPTPTPTPNPTPTPTPTPTTHTDQYEAALLRPGKTGSVAGGQIWMNLNGASGVGQIQATGGVPNTTYLITFDPFHADNTAFGSGGATSDASGNLNGTFTFPQKGTFSGIFIVSAGTNSMGQEVDPMDSGVDDNTGKVYNAPLVRAADVTPSLGGGGVTIGTDPLGSGFVSAGTGKLHAELHGAAANATYSIVECGNNAGSSCQAINQPGTITTDASGNATLDQNFFTNGDPALVFEFFNNSQLQFVTGFHVQ